MTLPPAIHLKAAAIRFGRTVLVFEAAIARGRITAVIGASGSGKSTLLHLVAGFETPDSGHIEILGLDAAGMEPSERPVSVIFQDHNLFAHLDIATNVGLGIDPRFRLTKVDRARIETALSDVGLGGFGARLPATLSGGERQRVALARALVRARPILLLDEPFAALDPGLRSDMGDLVKDLHRREDNTVLLVTHHVDDVRRLADDILFLDEGRVLLHEPASLFLDRREPAVVRQFLGLDRQASPQLATI